MSVDSSLRFNDDLNMSILTNRTTMSEDDLAHLTLFAKASASFLKRDTKYLKVVPSINRRFRKEYMEFCTGSAYEGEWNRFGFCGNGTYLYPHGVEYEGHFNKVGQFHGLGTLTYPRGQQMRGVWKNGKLFKYAYVFSCGEELDEQFSYCEMPNRKFHVEIKKYFGPTGQEFLTADQPTKEIPETCYDTVYGIYNPKCKFIFSHPSQLQEVKDYYISPLFEICRRTLSQEFILDKQIILEIPTEEEIKWIENHCRKGWDQNTGYKPDLYENWSAGRTKDSKLNDDKRKITKDKGYRVTTSKPKREAKLFTFIKKVHKPSSKRNIFDPDSSSTS